MIRDFAQLGLKRKPASSDAVSVSRARMSKPMELNAKEVDSDRFSRQQAAMGLDTLKKMLQSSVLVVGMRGLGVEVAKNVILAGVNRIVLWDNGVVEIRDLGSQFFLTENDVKANISRAKACVGRLAELNSQVDVVAYDGPLDEEFLSQFQCVVVTDGLLLEERIRINDACRVRGTKFVSADAAGLFANVFVDFGDSHVVLDTDGEEPRSSMIAFITQEKGQPSVVGCIDSSENRHGLMSGDLVKFSEVQGMNGINEMPAVEVKVIDPFTFSIVDCSHMEPYRMGGVVTQVKVSRTMKFKSLRESLAEPEFFIADFAKMDRMMEAHLLFIARDSFLSKYKRFPRAGDVEDSKAFLELAMEKTPKMEFNERRALWMSYGSSANLSPVVAFIGGLVAQTVFKGVTGKHTPLFQWMNFDALEALPKDPLPAVEYLPDSSRYDDQIAVFGREFQKKVLNSCAFMVGAGAIGCEVIKNWAMMGYGCGDRGMIHVTDMDVIETSNLSRQFLFRPWNVGKFKSEAAAAASCAMNPSFHVTTYDQRVGKETEGFFDDEFFSKLDLVCNALDNMEARLYVDSRCVFYEKPLLESGTLGTKGNTQIILPHLTESFASSADPPEEGFAICTLKLFPVKIEHTIQWARDQFQGMFFAAPEATLQYLKSSDWFEKQKSQGPMQLAESLRHIKGCLGDGKLQEFDQCVAWAVKMFRELFRDAPMQLVHSFPLDMVRDSGEPFWSGAKRPPSAVPFDLNDSMVVDFIVAAANLRAEMFCIEGCRDRDAICVSASKVDYPPFCAQEIDISIDDDDSTEQQDDNTDDFVENTLREIPERSTLQGLELKAIEFEKDDDTNFHIDFITAASNLRARSYRIPPLDRFKTKIIGGKIIPALITTTAVVCGLVCIEQYKVLQGKDSIEDYKNGFVNLALPFIGFSEPLKPQELDMRGRKFTLWDRIDFDSDLTLRELLNYFKEKHDIELAIISASNLMIYNEYMYMRKPKEKEGRLSMRVSEVMEYLSKEPFAPHVKTVVLHSVADEDDVEVPVIHVKFR